MTDDLKGDQALPEVKVPALALPERIVVGSNGAYWRDFVTTYSMCPVSSDNDPVERVAVYELVETNVWLIERGPALNHSPTVWWSGDGEIGWDGWTTDAWQARPYRTREEAEKVIRERFRFAHISQGPSATAVQHGFTYRPAIDEGALRELRRVEALRAKSERVARKALTLAEEVYGWAVHEPNHHRLLRQLAELREELTS